ncbi:carrier protein [Thecamonas trahens ATCC 50062]|uniref:Carrier protein n=1 Tax=Thecamonas trahens ATCC 50062 TaxID=461836 RepID=A0A0L0DRP9_THETB|nr:carrier protein [Thecamonas trahens ATCC 50062]KNC54686.1 carrier protein [Thecamonas trahens ATCC 50062]|eukprot:XP_013761588.1 carrier protein [Thecamonas trahens ATCC 50062]
MASPPSEAGLVPPTPAVVIAPPESSAAPPESYAARAAKDIVAGSIGGCCLTVTGYPFDLVKVRTQAAGPGAGGTWSMLRQTVATEGFRGLYKGMASPLTGMLSMNALCFLTYGQAKYALRPEGFDEDKDELPLASIAIAGATVGAILSFVEGPIDLVKTKVMLEGMGKKTSIGSGAMAQRIWKAHGVRGLFQGLTATLLRNTPANSMYFVAYEIVRRAMIEPGAPVPVHVSILAGGTAGIAYTGALGFDVIKSNIMSDTLRGDKYSGIIDCARKLYAAEGAGVFVKGWAPCLLRAFPGNAALFVGLNLTYNLFDIVGW